MNTVNTHLPTVPASKLERPAKLDIGNAPSNSAFSTAVSHFSSQALPNGWVRKTRSPAPVERTQGSPGVLGELSSYLNSRNSNLAHMMDEAIRTGNPNKMIQTTTALIDGGVESDLIAKTIGKTVSAVDQLTKLN